MYGHLENRGAPAVGVHEVFFQGGAVDGQMVAAQPAEQFVPGRDDPRRRRHDGSHDGAGGQGELP